MSQTDSLLEVYIYENLQLLEQLETILLTAEKEERFTPEKVDAVFRVLHTIKGSSAMMGYEGLTRLSHAMEDLFARIRADQALAYDHAWLCALAFSVQDFLNSEISPLQEGAVPSRDPQELTGEIEAFCQELDAAKGQPSQTCTAKTPASSPTPTAAGGKAYRAHILFEKGCMMESVRAFGVVKSVEGLCSSISTLPENVLGDGSDIFIGENGFTLTMTSSESPETLEEKIAGNFFIASLEFGEAPQRANGKPTVPAQETKAATAQGAEQGAAQKQSYISVRLDKLDKLMELVGELVIAESVLTKNPELLSLHLDSFEKGARQLGKLTDELQDAVMSVRMLPVSAPFHRLERILRDVCVRTGKKAELIIRGEDTEVDKGVIDALGDPLMHIIRNAVDHGIEPPEERANHNKPSVGRVTVSAENAAGEVVIAISDDGRGLDREALLKKAAEKGLLKKRAGDMTDEEAYALIFEPGFSTNSLVTEFSGRGVGMDVVRRDIEKVGGSASVESTPGQGMRVLLRIPQTLAIIDCMQVGVGEESFMIPLLSIVRSFRPKGEVVIGPDAKELALLGGKCRPVVRLHKRFAIPGAAESLGDGILVQLTSARGEYCLFVDRLLGEQQTVIKPMPAYVSRTLGAQQGVCGCTILGDGSVGLILDVNGLIE